MKTKLSILVLLFSFCCFAQNQNIKPEPLYNITIYKWAKDGAGAEKEVILNIFKGDSIRVTHRIDDQVEENFTDKLKIKDFEKGIFNFINGENIEHRVAYSEEEMAPAQDPVENQQVLHITVVTLKDLIEQGTNAYPGEYFKIIVADYNDTTLEALVKYFDNKEAQTLQKLLNI